MCAVCLWSGGLLRGGSSDAAAGSETVSYGAPKKKGCLRAEVTLDRKPGAIDFRVFCRALGEQEQMQVSASAFSRERKNSRSLLRTYRRHPRLAGSGRLRQFGTCKEIQLVLDCRGLAKGPVQILGKIWVPVGQRCNAKVTLFVPRRSECSEECIDVFRVKYLYRTRPRGC